jgi:NADP-dependent 3-hydroxy acid dehydrogenase YdfG
LNHFDLTGLHVAITGASSGFGHHFAAASVITSLLL